MFLVGGRLLGHEIGGFQGERRGSIAGKPRSYRSTLICRSERAAIRLARDSVLSGNKYP
ncbi:hypothetical protein C4K14_4700 [Pseudomonas chlororaphis subsp. aureofaciens]|nr:hypothetical protein C4K14_4700 [Pseudomonas chlororaphis subsp. aureofaciens]